MNWKHYVLFGLLGGVAANYLLGKGLSPTQGQIEKAMNAAKTDKSMSMNQQNRLGNAISEEIKKMKSIDEAEAILDKSLF